MDDYQEKNIKKELAIDSANNATAKITDASSILDMSQTIQQLLAMSSIAGGAILSPMQLLQASASPGASTSQLSLPWIVPHHYQQMMVLQQGLAQPFLLSDVVDDKNGHVVVMPTGDQVGHYGSNVSAVSSAADLPATQASVPSAHLFGTFDSNAGQLRSYQMSPAQKTAVKEGSGQGHQLGPSVDRSSSKRGLVQPQGQLLPDSAKIPRPRPPKKPLTPYMMFSKEMWHQVKAANSHLSLVTEIGAIIGSMWRELEAEKKEHYNELFSRDKIRYDEEIRLYLKDHNMHPSDLIRARLSKKKDSKSPTQHRPPVATTQHAPSAIGPSPGQQQQQQLVQSLLGYPVTADGTQALISLDGALPSNLMQAWAGHPIQQILAQMGLSGQLTQAAAATSSDDSQMMNEVSGHHQQQQLALQAIAMLSNASSVCGSSNELVPSTAVRSSDSSAVSRLNAESAAISAADRSKLWSWSTGQSTNTTTSSSSMQNIRSTDCVAVAAAAATGGAPEESAAGRAFKVSNNKAVYCSGGSGNLSDWTSSSEAKSEEANRLERRLLFLENALTEKNTEIEKLVDQLGKAHRVIANFRIEPDIAEGKALNGGGGSGGGGGGGGGRVVAAKIGSCAQRQ